ncbi:MAG: tol-pal system protein YbgF [Rudaea sp.]|uniref:tol-pal system protein YbgF n=1 Tax=Rudaea sp. TaxID=2136325 RepID=UPI0039E22B0A
MSTTSTRFLRASALLAVAALAAPAHAQRESLAERVARLEQQSGSQGGSVELVNQINALQSQVQQLQGQNEELKHQLDQLKQQVHDQAIDADSRLSKLEGKPSAATAANAPANNGQMQDISLGAGAAVPPNTAPPAVDSAPAPLPPPANPADEKAAYDAAFATLKDGRYAESARAFQSFLGQYPNSDLAPNAYYWLGESYYVTQNYPVSLDAFNKLLAQYPNSQKASAALLKVGYCQYELKQWDQAEATLNQVVAKYPGTQEANLAQGRLRALKMERR